MNEPFEEHPSEILCALPRNCTDEPPGLGMDLPTQEASIPLRTPLNDGLPAGRLATSSLSPPIQVLSDHTTLEITTCVVRNLK